MRPPTSAFSTTRTTSRPGSGSATACPTLRCSTSRSPATTGRSTRRRSAAACGGSRYPPADRKNGRTPPPGRSPPSVGGYQILVGDQPLDARAAVFVRRRADVRGVEEVLQPAAALLERRGGWAGVDIEALDDTVDVVTAGMCGVCRE